MPDPHPKSIPGRLRAVQTRWADQCQPGDDVFLILDAGEEIQRLTAKLAATRKHLKVANRALENKAIRLENLGRLLHRRSGELLPATLRQMAARQCFDPDAIRAAAARLDGPPGVGTPPEAEKAAREPGLSENNLHQTTP